MINTKLADLYEQQSKLRKDIEKVNAAIQRMCDRLDRETIEESKSSVTPDPEEFGRWLKHKRSREHRIEAKRQIKEANTLLHGYTAVYALYDKKEIVYVGITNNIERRINQHKRSDKVFDRYEVITVNIDRFYALREEHRLIELHKPKYNKDSLI